LSNVTPLETRVNPFLSGTFPYHLLEPLDLNPPVRNVLNHELAELIIIGTERDRQTFSQLGNLSALVNDQESCLESVILYHASTFLSKVLVFTSGADTMRDKFSFVSCVNDDLAPCTDCV
jgi:hypothetical protein